MNAPRLSALAAETTALQAALTTRWHEEPAAAAADASDLLRLVRENHRRNFDLWHCEDEARRDDLGPEHVSRMKRAIDQFNQERNDCIQRLDEWLVVHLAPPDAGCPLNSETPGMMIDRLSILALKLYHMDIEARRADATTEHREKARGKIAVLARQREDLQHCLEELIDDVVARRRTFRVYFQFKMYNDRALNPALYRQPEPAR